MLIILEGLLLAVIGCAIGLFISHVGMQFVAYAMEDSYRYSFTGWKFLKVEWQIIGGALAIGFLAALFPAIQASRTDISDTLAEG